MNIIDIAMKELRLYLREKEFYIMMILFPIALIFVLGTALGGNSGETNVFGCRAVYYSSDQGQLSTSFQHFNESLDKEMLVINKVDDIEKGMKEIEYGEAAAFIIIDNKNNSIEVLKNSAYDFEGNFVEGMIRAFSEKLELMIYTKGREISQETFTTSKGLDGKDDARAIDYYGITMLTMILTYLISYMTSSVVFEKRRGTQKRINAAGVSGIKLYFGYLIAGIVLAAVQITSIMGVAIYGFKVNYGDNFGYTIAIIAIQAVLMISIGLYIGVTADHKKPLGNMTNMIIPLMVFLGGGYFPLSNMGLEFLEKVAYISPIKWINTSLFNSIYGSGSQELMKVAIVGALGTVILMILTAMKFSKKEGAQ